MSVILVTFPNAPKVSEEAIKKVSRAAHLQQAGEGGGTELKGGGSLATGSQIVFTSYVNMCTATNLSIPPQEKELKEEARAKIEKRLEGMSVVQHDL